MKTERTVTKRALLRRINRILAKRGRRLCTSRSWGERGNLGDHHVIDSHYNTVVDTHVELDGFARTLGALNSGESIAEMA
jgi:hypothetical protein